ncbi:ATP-binding cassette domain-containing protein [Planctopirus hydrillae]|uniref:AAA+ ATPase domain-containing protein n=1 Tax=Planctopirus hydrillae TaxID=1841610 RepID=A0A1C3E6A2_9PLAN|nr:ATP-binding cassette domain-containing protein [Planctopirus hydrillae]ODA28777.1 hypothetical protein A6X21_11045 [Planctopirus hydrillae]
MRLNVCYHIAPKTPTVQASMVCDHFGLTLDGQQQVIARDLELPVTSGNLIAFVGPSGSGKSSLMRAVAAELKSSGQGDVLWLDHLPPVASLVADALALPPLDAFRLLAQCGLAEPQLLLRTPDELSDGQRFRFRLAQSVAEALRRQSQHASQSTWIVADEFTSPLDRTLAKVIARNWHSLLRQHRLGGLIATTHTDILDDLQPDLIVTCSHDAPPQLSGLAASPTFSSATSSALRTLREADPPTPAAKKKEISFFHELALTTGTKRDWAYFARWHYRSHSVGIVRFVTILWHLHEPIGICVFTSAPLSLRSRNQYFGLSGRWTRTGLQAIDRQFCRLARVVIHPTYRGAGLAAPFVRASCQHVP